ncbi:uncharacterized protein EI90DRAFT_3159818 [Cantharellus anzutake]|uniref:uncharacterized protein n=1 Tax=Cantharellus anzutake TaxID=1750568 RepID=UPI001904FDA3|nr:uncharacterized protein EI90DRAFT_3159818 [Cantharellus anzutake]KAF8313022.1 hypothetical protein EI90DRAFT_3159818 [Cantharellus anzutake]
MLRCALSKPGINFRTSNFRRAHSAETLRARQQHFPTLDEVACTRELPQPRPRSAYNTSYHPQHARYIWEHMVSSPPSSPPPVHRHKSPSPPTSSVHMPAFNSSSFSSLKRKPNVTMEWACANVSSASCTEETDQEVLTPSDCQSLASIPTTSTRLPELTPYGPPLPSKALEKPYGNSRTLSRSHTLGSKSFSTLRIPSTLQIRTVRNAQGTPIVRASSTPLLPVSTSKKRTHQERSASGGSTRQKEMDAALALCGLLSS